MQEKALAVTIKEIAGARVTGFLDESGRKAVTPGELAEVYLAIARGLMERGLIGVSPEEAARLRKEGSPTEEELDALLES